ncbi:class A beta-lactamase [Gracilibacillus caseinilyticus]|uniref:Beta-lactamase n=1 Tax=Gracilibacillus caseinilyticus TaxID=2932256 RepID=A0ABY4EWB6_9BACI|nr:class A beta-lactamase [Gracilibacillus caseinilyticus]UOQ48713.1 class A beta-lactamase [Gracilibacillus caseinilyticus]
MSTSNPIKQGVLYIALLALITLTACTNVDNRFADKKDNTDQSINKDKAFAQLEKDFDALLGVYAIDTGSNQTVAYNPDQRFAYTSTFKVLAAAALLKKNDIDDLEKVIHFDKDDLVTYSPVTENHVETGMTLLEISEAAIRKSDNTAGNLMLEELGGPAKFKQALRDLGDNVTNPERYETELNNFTPDDNSDTSTPKAMATNLKEVALGDFLTKEKRELLIDWMLGNATGNELIRAGKPKGWEVADKSGAGSYGTRNDIAIVWPADREPIVIAIMSRHDTEDAEYDNELIAKAAEVTLNAFK